MNPIPKSVNDYESQKAKTARSREKWFHIQFQASVTTYCTYGSYCKGAWRETT